MKYSIPFFLVTLSLGGLLLGGCSTMQDSVLLGVGLGTATGTAIGIGVEPSPGSALIGAGVGALLGGVFGYLGHKDKERRDALLRSQTKPQKSPDLPTLVAPDASCTEVPEHIEASRYYGPQIQCVIEHAARWSR
jgi:hypothetical protein